MDQGAIAWQREHSRAKMLSVGSIEVKRVMNRVAQNEGVKQMQTTNSVVTASRHKEGVNAPMIRVGTKQVAAVPAGSTGRFATTALGGIIPARPVFVSAGEIEIRKAEINKASASFSVGQEDRS
jgi:hypothetical protein